MASSSSTIGASFNNTREVRSVPHLVVCRIRSAEPDVRLQGVVEEVDILEHHGDLRHEVLNPLITDLDATDTDNSPVRIPEPRNQTRDVGFSGTGGTDQGSHRLWRYGKGHIVQDRLIVPVAEIHAIQFERTGSFQFHRCLRLGHGRLAEHLSDAAQVVASHTQHPGRLAEPPAQHGPT